MNTTTDNGSEASENTQIKIESHEAGESGESRGIIEHESEPKPENEPEQEPESNTKLEEQAEQPEKEISHVQGSENDAYQDEVTKKEITDVEGEAGDEDEEDNENQEKHNETTLPQTSNNFKESKDYSKIFKKYQEKFDKVYSISQKLFLTEKAQRQTFHYYHRRNNALIDLIEKFDAKHPRESKNVISSSINNDEFISETDKSRIEKIIEINPRLKSTLTPLLSIDDSTKETIFKNSYKINLILNESIPELINDDLDIIETNPQDSDNWVKRNYPHLVISKYKSIDLKIDGIKENFKSQPMINKRKRKIVKDENDDNLSDGNNKKVKV